MAKKLVNFEFIQVATIEVDIEDESYNTLLKLTGSLDLKNVSYYSSYTKPLILAEPDGDIIWQER